MRRNRVLLLWNSHGKDRVTQPGRLAAGVVPLAMLSFWVCSPLLGQDGPTRLFRQWDRNGDGVLTRGEVPANARRSFTRIDANQDGKVTLAEHLAGMRRARPTSNTAAPRWPETNLTVLKIKQTWHQEPGGYDRTAFVSVPKRGTSKLPVVIFFHGNGGVAARALNQWRYLNEYVLVVPQGYRNSWNISGERSQAPDVRFVGELITRVAQVQPRADLKNVTVIGSSNGSGLIHRLMIELDKKPFQRAILLSASLVIEQYHDGSFWKPSKSTDDYDIRHQPTPVAEMIYFHGSNDKVVPYEGGLRQGKHEHLSAQRTAFVWARAFGFRGTQIPDADGEEIEKGIALFQYSDVHVAHYKLIGAGHGPRPYGKQMRALIAAAIKKGRDGSLGTGSGKVNK